MFQSRFADLVRDGIKLSTIRLKRDKKNTPQVGELMSLRSWTGKPYRSKQEKLATVIIEGVYEITIADTECHPIRVMHPQLGECGASDLDGFARADGFDDWTDMRDWFRIYYGLPFNGILICWKMAN